MFPFGNVSFAHSLLMILFFIMSSSFPRLYKGSAGYCSMYRGEVCRGLLRHSALVFFNSSLPDPEQAQEFLAHGGWAELEETSSLCQPAARSLLCHAAFQDCSPSGLGPAPKPVCRYTTESLIQFFIIALYNSFQQICENHKAFVVQTW